MAEIKEIVGQQSKNQRYLVFVVIVGLVILVGVWAGIWLSRQGPQIVEDGSGREIVIEEITLAGLRTPGEAANQNPALRTQSQYRTGEPLALRIKTASGIRDDVQISVRLLKEPGGIKQLSPSSISLSPGISTFCCWQIDEPGQYTLQIFRPDRQNTSLPLQIR